jgi:hypothetical protein
VATEVDTEGDGLDEAAGDSDGETVAGGLDAAEPPPPVQALRAATAAIRGSRTVRR